MGKNKLIILSFTIIILLFDSNLFGKNSSYPYGFTEFNNKLYFEANDGIHGKELWSYDGINEPTMVVDIDPNGSSYPYGFIVFNNKLYFGADDGTHGYTLWVYDGINEPSIVQNSNSEDVFDPYDLTIFNNKLYFQAKDGVNGYELWESNGSADGTKLVKNINDGSVPDPIPNPYEPNFDDSYPYGFTELNGELYFFAYVNYFEQRLFKTDGTGSGTIQISDTSFNDYEYDWGAYDLIVLNNKLYFIGYDENNHYFALWESNGSADGTRIFDYSDFYPYDLAVFNNKLYLDAGINDTNYELWESNGSADGTSLVKDINSNGGSYPDHFVEFNNKLYFQAYDEVNGTELWESNGSADGTSLVKDINPNGSSYPNGLTVFNNKLYFEADGGSYGDELWVYDGVNEPSMVKDIYFDNTLPVASNVVINGTIDLRESIIGSYDFSDYDTNQSETNSIYKWYRADDSNGTNAESISGATSKNYTVTTADSGKYLAFGVIPNDGMNNGNEVKSLYSTRVPIKVDFDPILTLNSWNMITVPNDRNVSVNSLSGATIWTYNNNSNQWEIPSILTAGKGYILSTSSTIGLTLATETNSTVPNDYTTIKNVNSNEWTLVGISKSTDGIEWSDIYNPDNTLKTNCDYTQAFYYDTINDSWNTTLKIPYLGAIWVKQNCQNL